MSDDPVCVHIVKQVAVERDTGRFYLCCGLMGTAVFATTETPFQITADDKQTMLWVGMPSQTVVRLKELESMGRIVGHTYISDVRNYTCKKCVEAFHDHLAHERKNMVMQIIERGGRDGD